MFVHYYIAIHQNNFEKVSIEHVWNIFTTKHWTPNIKWLLLLLYWLSTVHRSDLRGISFVDGIFLRLNKEWWIDENLYQIDNNKAMVSVNDIVFWTESLFF